MKLLIGTNNAGKFVEISSFHGLPVSSSPMISALQKP